MKNEGAGKGDSYRVVDWNKYAANYDSIFRKTKTKKDKTKKKATQPKKASQSKEGKQI